MASCINKRKSDEFEDILDEVIAVWSNEESSGEDSNKRICIKNTIALWLEEAPELEISIIELFHLISS